MSKRKIIFRADASKQTGYGHLIRSIALAGYLKDDFDCHFASYNAGEDWGCPTNYQLGQIMEVAVPIPLFARDLQEFDDLFLSELHGDEIVVLDNYYFTTDYQQKIKDKGCKLVCVDDMHDRHMVCDLLLTASPLSRSDFSLEPYTSFKGGIEWAFLRNPFLRPISTRSVNSEIKRVVTAMGGADAFNLTDKISGIIKKLLPQATLDIICGEAVQISQQTADSCIIHRNVSADEIVKLFDSADLGIFPASTVCIEAFSRRLPVIGGFYVDNQIEFYNYLDSRKMIAPLGNLLDKEESLENRLNEILATQRPMPVILDFKNHKKKFIELFKSL